MEKLVTVLAIILVLGLAIFFGYPHFRSGLAAPADLDKASGRYESFAREHNLSDPVPDCRIVVTKDNRMLYLLSGDVLIERWPVALGSDPKGTKTASGDGRTPVGKYSIYRKDRRSKHHLFMAITYPARQDADRALVGEIITDRVHQEIYQAANSSRQPPQDTPLGGGIGIHGGGTSYDWTNGSIAVENDTIEILWGACPIGTPVIIFENFTDWELNFKMPSYK